MNRTKIEAVAVGAIAAFMLPVGLQAALLPKSFFDDFPLGRRWIVTGGGAYNEHLIRDVGFLFLALVMVTAWSIWVPAMRHPIAVAWLLQGIPHLVFHTQHLHGYETVDKVGLVATLAAIPILAAAALWSGWPRSADH